MGIRINFWVLTYFVLNKMIIGNYMIEKEREVMRDILLQILDCRIIFSTQKSNSLKALRLSYLSGYNQINY